MDINDFRKQLFLNSQYCTHYNVRENTVLAGIMRDFGYRYSTNLPQEKLSTIDAVYRKFTTGMNAIIAVELLLYVYFFVFPYFTKIMKMPFFVAALLIAIIPLAALYLTYFGVNLYYENYLKKFVGTFQKVKFQPTLELIDENDYLKYKKTSRKSAYVLAVIIFIFVSSVFTPLWLENLIANKNYKTALNISNAYLKFIPVNAQVYSQKAFAEFKLKKYKEAVRDFENANKYSLSNNFDQDIAGVKTYYADKNEMLKILDELIQNEEDEGYRQYLLSQKAVYLLNVKEYQAAINLFDKLIAVYEKSQDVQFDADAVYYRRARAKYALGDVEGARQDRAIAESACQGCKFDTETSLVREP